MLNGIGIFNKNVFTIFYTNDIVVGSTPVYVEDLHFFGKGFSFFYIRQGNDSIFQTSILRYRKIEQ